MTDPFAHHPELRDKITPLTESFFRDFSLEKLAPVLAEAGITEFPVYDDATREAIRAEALARRPEGDLWVFAYGSLLWDPALDFAELRRAVAPHHERRFILRDIYGARGTAEAPGLMAALDAGPGCAGLVFRIAEEKIEAETDILFRREMLGPGYHAAFIPVMIGDPADDMHATALTFTADHATDIIASDITIGEQIGHIATGHGFLGTSFAYLQNVITHLHDMGIPDPDLDALMEDVLAFRAKLDAES